MQKDKKPEAGPGAIDLIEEAGQVLRRLPPGAHVAYYLGSLPFVCGFLYFWADMSCGAFASKYCARDAFFLSVLFVWMKCWQAVFASRVRAQVCMKGPSKWTVKRALRLLSIQTALQPTGLIVLPLTALIMLPFAWTYAFYQNLLFFGDGRKEGFGGPFAGSARNAGLSPGQNILAMAILLLLGIFVAFDIGIAVYLAPHLVKTLFGIETAAAMVGFNVLNTTFLAVVLSVTYLVVDPVAKTAYALRSFYGESLKNGDDLRTELKALTARKGKITAISVLFILLPIFFFSAGSKSMAAERETGITGRVNPALLDVSIEKVLRRRQFAWRMPMPRQEKKNPGESSLFRFVRAAIRTMAQWMRPVGRWVLELLKWIVKGLSRIGAGINKNTAGPNRVGRVRTLAYFFLGLAAAALALLVFKLSLARKKTEAEAPVPISVPDMEDGSVKADDLPSEQWSRMARELMDKSDYRLALRAFYLAGLAHLARKGIVAIAISKSNRDYERELQKKGPAALGLREAFEKNGRTFDSVWYGMHEVSGGLLDNFMENHERIISLAERL